MKRLLVVGLLWGVPAARADSESLRRQRDLSLQRNLAAQRNGALENPRAGATVNGAGVSGRFDGSGQRIWLSDGRVGTVYGNQVQFSDGSSGWINGSFISAPPQKQAAQPPPPPPQQQQPVVYLPAPTVVYTPPPVLYLPAPPDKSTKR